MADIPLRALIAFVGVLVLPRVVWQVMAVRA
jgi:hypothetical protein